MKVTSEAGTDLDVNMEGAQTVGIWGWTEKPGTLAHWPGGIVVSFPKAKSVNGTLVIDLPRDEPDARLARFVAVHGRTLGALARNGTRVEAVDLRYRNGFAARIPAFRERGAKAKV